MSIVNRGFAMQSLLGGSGRMQPVPLSSDMSLWDHIQWYAHARLR
jgi:hypothetical protein